MSNNKFAQKAFALTLGAVLALGTVPAFAYASETPQHSTGDNSAGENEYVARQTKNPGWFDEHGNPIDKDGNPIKEDKGSNNASDNNGGEVEGVKNSWEVHQILESARNLWNEMYPEADVPNGLFDFVSGGVTFPPSEPNSNITDNYTLDMKKREFRGLVEQVYPKADFPEWLFGKISQ